MSFYYPRRDRDQLALTAQGLITETWPRAAVASAATIMVDGRAYFIAVGLRAGDVVSNLAIAIHVAGATMTLSKVGLYSKAGTRLAVSADQGTAWQSAGMKNVALASPYTVTADDGYFVAVIGKGTTLPRLASGNTNVNQAAAVGSGMLSSGNLDAQTDLPASATISGSADAVAYWVGVS